MNAIGVVPAPVPPRSSFVIPLVLLVLFSVILGWAAHSLFSLQPVPVPLVPCKTCAEKCPCPRLSGAIRCGCAN